MDIISNRPENNSQVQKVRESFFAKFGQALREIFRGVDRPAHSL